MDVIVNKTLKESIRIQSEQHLQENLDKYTSGKITASERRVLITNWCGNAWSRLDKDSVIRGFKKIGLSVELDGSESTSVNIPKLPMYKMGEMIGVDAEYVVDDSDDESDDDDTDEVGGNEGGEENGEGSHQECESEGEVTEEEDGGSEHDFNI